MKNGLNDLRHVDTRWALTDAERQEVRRKRQREALGLTEPRVKIGGSYLPPSVAQFAYIRLAEAA
jgi:hypothetical protein